MKAKRIVSLFLALVMLTALLPAAILAAQSGSCDYEGGIAATEIKALQRVEGSNNSLHTGVNTADAATVWYGDKAWYVVGYNGEGVAPEAGTLTLLSNTGLDQTQFSFLNGQSNKYENSELHLSVNSIVSVFSEAEKSAIVKRTLERDIYDDKFTDCIAGSRDLKDQLLWPLSTKEANDLNETLRIPGDWWLRSPGNDDHKAAFVGDALDVAYYGVTVFDIKAVRAAFRLDLDSVLLASSAEGGKQGEGKLAPVGDFTSSEWKLTLLDDGSEHAAGDGHKDFKAELVGTDGDPNKWKIAYSGAKTGDNEYISAIVEGNGILYYGRLCKAQADPADPGAGPNTVTVDLSGIPIEDNNSSGYNRLYVFNEQYNGDKKTDYASGIQLIRYPTRMSVTADDVNEGEDAFIEVRLPDPAIGTVTLTVNGKSYESDLSDGLAVLALSGLKAGSYTVDVSYPGDSNFSGCEAAAKFSVIRTFSGTAEDPYRIGTYDDLLRFSALVNGGTTGAWAVLTGDITADEREWIPIGSSANKYSGTFDGMGYRIKKLALPLGNKIIDCGLFGYVDADGRVKNVGLEECSFSGSNWVGSVAGRNKGKLENCCSVEAVIGLDGAETGGVVGRNYGTVENCYSYSGAAHYGQGALGGVAGWNYEGGALKNCFSYLGSHGLGASAIPAGVAGMNNGTVDKCCYPVLDPVIKGIYSGAGDVKSLDIDEFKDQTTFSDWDFENVWYMDRQAGHPKLRVFAGSTETGILPGSEKALQLVTNGEAENIAGAQKSNVYFGTYQQSAKEGGGFNADPIKWRVLHNADGKLFMLADQNLDVACYNEDHVVVTWEDATLRKWLNGYDGRPYDDSFIGSAFSAKEAAAVVETELVNGDNPDHKTPGGKNTTDKVFPLSIAEATDTAYGFTEFYTGKSTNTAYTASGGHTGSKKMSDAGAVDWWWLRSPGANSVYASCVIFDGSASFYGDEINSTYIAVRPALNADLNSVLFTSAAERGKRSAENGALSAVGYKTSNDWKLTLLDGERSGFTASLDSADGDILTIKYSGAKSGKNEFISALIVNGDGEVTHYGRLAAAESGDNKTVTVDLAGKKQSGDKLFIFNEQYNGDYLTDYASSLNEIVLPKKVKAIQLVASGSADNIDGAQASNVYFGTYQQTSDRQGGFNVDPIKWRVLQNADGRLFLLSDKNLDAVMYHSDSESITWEDSEIRDWLNNYFCNVAFTDAELAAIPKVNVVNDDNPYHGTEGGNDTTDKVFLLSIAEVMTEAYGFPNYYTSTGFRQARNTDYAKDRGVSTYGRTLCGYWWLRSPGGDDSYHDHAAFVGDGGDVGSFGCFVSDDSVAVRPALNIDLNSVLFTSAAEGGKSSGAAGADALTAVGNYAGSDWKLTLLDDGSDCAVGEGHKDFKAEILCTDFDPNKWIIEYSGAKTGENEYISAIIKDSTGAVTYYGRLSQAQSGDYRTVTVDLAGKMNEGDKLYVFNEQINGDYMTDYASSLQLIKHPMSLSVKAEDSDIYAGEDMVITVALQGPATGLVTVSVNGVDHEAEVRDGGASLTLSDLEPGDYRVEASFAGDDYYSKDQDTTRFTVHLPETVDVKGVAEWKDAGNESKRPEKITARLLANGNNTSITQEVSESGSGHWAFNFESLPSRDTDRTQILYSVAVDDIPNYTTAVEKVGFNSFRIVITYHPPVDHGIQVIGGKANVGTAKVGDTVTITADMPQTGYGFVKWAEVEGVQFANPDSYTTTFVMPDKDVTLTAVTGKITLPDVGDQTYTGDPIELTFAPSDVKLEGLNRDLVQGTDYELSYENNVLAGHPSVILTFKAPLLGTTSDVFNIVAADISTAEVSFSNLFTKKVPIDVELTVTWNGKILENGVDYTVDGDDLTGLNYGVHSVSINGIGNFDKYKSVDFTIDDVMNYDVEIYPGANMTKTADSGGSYQKYYIDEDAIESVVFTANEGWYFPEDYAVASDNGVCVTRNGFTQITVSGKPTGEVQIFLTSPTAKAKEPTPNATFNATGSDTGTLSGVSAGMKYRIGNGQWRTVSGASVGLTDLGPCAITIIQPGNGATTVDSDPQTITVKKAAAPSLTAEQISDVGGKGSIPTTAAHEISTDGVNWTACTGETTGLAPGKYFVRVKAAGTALTSDAQEIVIIEPGWIEFSGGVTLTGRPLTAGDVFAFDVFENGVCVATGQNDASGEVGYTEIDYFFGDVGTHVYKVKQRATALPGVTIDTREYQVSVRVSCAPGDDELTITPTEEFSGLYFTNTYAKQTPPDLTVPTGLKAVYGQTLADVALGSGWAWDDPLSTKVGNAGINKFSATYTPADTTLYRTVTTDLSVTVSRATPDHTDPAGLEAVYGQTLGDITLPDGWTWDDPLTTKVGGAGRNTFTATFTPEDTDNFETVKKTFEISVAQAEPETTEPENLTAVYGQTLGDIALPDGWTWDDPLDTEVGGAGRNTFSATFTPEDTDNFETVKKSFEISVAQAVPETTEPENLTAVYGQTLGDITLPDGWTWDDPLDTEVGGAGRNTFTATFTPEDTDNFETVKKSFEISVAQAVPETTEPENLTAVYGQTLGDITLPDGWTWDDPLDTEVGGAGRNTFTATFTPEDEENYVPVTVTLTVDVAKAVISSDGLAEDEKPAAAKDLTEDDLEQELVTAPGKLPEGYTGVEYSVDGETWSDKIPTGKEAGEYTVQIRYVGDENHEDLEGDPVTVTIAKTAYAFLPGEGEELTHTKESGKDLTATVVQIGAEDTSFEHFAGVYIGDVELQKDADYTVVKGSTVVTILSAALDRLDVGVHTLTVRFRNGEASTQITVLAKNSDPISPVSGDNSPVGLWTAIMALCAVAASSILIIGRKKRVSGK